MNRFTTAVIARFFLVLSSVFVPFLDRFVQRRLFGGFSICSVNRHYTRGITPKRAGLVGPSPRLSVWATQL